MNERMVQFIKVRIESYKDCIHYEGHELSHDDLVELNSRITELESLLEENDLQRKES